MKNRWIKRTGVWLVLATALVLAYVAIASGAGIAGRAFSFPQELRTYVFGDVIPYHVEVGPIDIVGQDIASTSIDATFTCPNGSRILVTGIDLKNQTDRLVLTPDGVFLANSPSVSTTPAVQGVDYASLQILPPGSDIPSATMTLGDVLAHRAMIAGRVHALLEAKGTATAVGEVEPLAVSVTYDTYNDVILPSTDISVVASPTMTAPGGMVTWAITERNDSVVVPPVPAGKSALSDPSVALSGAYSATLTSASVSFVGGDANTNGILDAGEAWMWSVETTAPATGPVNVTVTGFGTVLKGLPSERNVTFAPAGDPLVVFHDADERAAASVDVMPPSTMVEISGSPSDTAPGGTITWTVTEKNDTVVPAGGVADDFALSSPYVAITGDATATLNKASASYDSGDTDADGMLDVNETWKWILTSTAPASGSVSATAIGHGMIGGFDVTWVAQPTQGVIMDAQEKDMASVDVMPPSTMVSISGAPASVFASDTITWTVTEKNDTIVPSGGDADDFALSSPYVALTGNVTLTLNKASASYDSGDTDADGMLDVNETWKWILTSVAPATGPVNVMAIGHGMLNGMDVTYAPAGGAGLFHDADERASAAVDVKQRGGATRTPGFWATHLAYTTHVFEDHLGGEIDVGWTKLTDIGDVMGALWANPASTSSGAKRSRLSQAKIIATNQLVAAILNTGLDNGAPVPQVSYMGGTWSVITAMQDALKASDRATILSLSGVLDTYNNSGDFVPLQDVHFTGGAFWNPATPQAAKAAADYAKEDTLI